MNKTNLILSIFICVFYFKINAQTVYITDNGTKYHAKKCRLAKSGKKGITLSEALNIGYEACKNCKADKIGNASKKEKVHLF